MKRLWLLFLSVCALTHASAYYDAVPEITSVEQQIGRYELLMSAKTPNSEVEQHIAEESNSIAERNLIADVIEAMLEDFRDVIINGNGELPPLDPYVIDSLGPFEIVSTGVQVTANLQNLRLEGLMWYVVDNVAFNALRLTLNLQVTIPRLTLTGRYDAKARITFINHEAGGNFRVFVNRIIVEVDLRLGTRLLSGTVYLRELDIKLDIHDTFIHIEGMTGSSLLNSIINSYIQSITQETIQNELGNVSEELSLILFDIIDEMLKDFSLPSNTN